MILRTLGSIPILALREIKISWQKLLSISSANNNSYHTEWQLNTHKIIWSYLWAQYQRRQQSTHNLRFQNTRKFILYFPNESQSGESTMRSYKRIQALSRPSAVQHFKTKKRRSIQSHISRLYDLLIAILLSIKLWSLNTFLNTLIQPIKNSERSISITHYL